MFTTRLWIWCPPELQVIAISIEYWVVDADTVRGQLKALHYQCGCRIWLDRKEVSRAWLHCCLMEIHPAWPHCYCSMQHYFLGELRAHWPQVMTLSQERRLQEFLRCRLGQYLPLLLQQPRALDDSSYVSWRACWGDRYAWISSHIHCIQISSPLYECEGDAAIRQSEWISFHRTTKDREMVVLLYASVGELGGETSSHTPFHSQDSDTRVASSLVNHPG